MILCPFGKIIVTGPVNSQDYWTQGWMEAWTGGGTEEERIVGVGDQEGTSKWDIK